MKRMLILALAAGCVPASEPLPPAGAAGVVTEPSAAARGEPFVTDDGWTIRFERLVLRAYVTLQPVRVPGADDDAFGYETTAYLWNGGDRAELYSPGLRPGPWNVGLQLQGAFLPYEAKNDDARNLGVDAKAAARLASVGDEGPGPYDFALGPSFSFAATAAKGGRVVRIDVTANTSPFFAGKGSLGPSAPVSVVADALVTTPLPIVAENLFGGIVSGRTTFEPYAAADDGDGTLTTHELTSASVACATCPDNLSGEKDDASSLLDVLRFRAQSMLEPK